MAKRNRFPLTLIALVAVASGAGSIFAQGAGPQGGQGFQGGPGGQGQGGPGGGMRMGPPHGPMLLLNPQVIKELKETDEQVKQIQELMKNQRGQGRGGRQGGPPPGQGGGGDEGFGGPPPEDGQGGQGFQGGGQGGGQGGQGFNPEEGKKMEAAIKKILNDSQYKRYRQIDIQVDGPRAFQRPEVADTLKLTEEQHDKIQQIMEANRPQGGPQQGGQGFQGGPPQGGPPQGGQGQRGRGQGGPGADMEKKAEEIMKKILAVLTDGQKSKYKEMTGAAFKLERPQGGPGQGGPGGPPPGGGGFDGGGQI